VAEDDIPFEPGPEATPATGLYCGEQDMFCFLIDPTGWAEINGEAFAPGFFLWNSEVGRRSVGVQTFWFQAVCANHIVWDAVEVVEFSRKHTANVHESLNEIRSAILNLVDKRDQRRDGFVTVIKKAMESTLGEDSDEVLKTLKGHGVTQALAKRAIESARQRGRFTIFAVVDALTRLSGEMKYAGDRAEVDAKAGQLLALAA
jgi:L-amino acid N-acyltransferase YncA